MTPLIALLAAGMLLQCHSYLAGGRSANIPHTAERYMSALRAGGRSAAADKYDLELTSPCKVNLFLRILERLPTGYHSLASLFQAVSLSDKMSFSRLPDSAMRDELLCTDSSLQVDQSNLVIKALDLMREKTGLRAHFRVLLDKHVPMQAGLGGGSGNAATAMHAFNVLCGYPATLEQLKVWSGAIGSDITFFFSSGTAYCTGRGEIVTPLQPLPASTSAVLDVYKPIEGLSTQLVFRALDLGKLRTDRRPEALLEAFIKEGPFEAAKAGAMVNDLEPPAFACEPLLLRLKDAVAIASKSMGEELGGVMMSGSGTSVYSISSTAGRSDDAISKEKRGHIDAVLAQFPNMRHFRCKFVSKKDDIYSWY